MSKTNISAQVEELVMPIIETTNLELVEVEYVKEGAQWYLRVFIDKPGGVGLEDCQAVSGELEKVMDEKDPIPQSYILEVSSPGIERPLKKPEDYRRFAGRLVSVHTYAPVNNQKKFIGQLIGLNDIGVQLEIDGQRVVVPLEKVSSTRLVAEF